MKLKMLSERGIPPERRALMHRELTAKNLTDEEIQALKQVYNHVIKGESHLKEALVGGDINMMDVIHAIKNKRCLPSHDRDLGSTYIENVVGSAISDIYQGKEVNKVRRLFGLAPLDLTELQRKSMRKAAKHKNQPQDSEPK